LPVELVDFRWWVCRDGYDLEQKGRRNFLTSASDQFEGRRSLQLPNLFSIFADGTPATAKGMQEFCSRYGVPYGGRPDMAPSGRPLRVSVDVDELLNHQRRFRRAVNLLRKGDVSELAKLWNSSHGSGVIRTELRVGPNERLEMVFAPPDLIQAMWLQFAQFACSQAQLFRCQRCGKPFQVGTGTGRRRTAKFCSNACKVAAFRERHAGEGK
jgi:hypothetical protein